MGFLTTPIFLVSMKKKIFSILIAASAVLSLSAQNASNGQPLYKRSSIYSLMVKHTEQKMADEIHDEYIGIETPDKYNDHDLSVKVITLDEKLAKAKSDEENAAITDFLNRNEVASRMVAKWFERNSEDGSMSMDLIKKRGLYNASEFDKAMAARSSRSKALLEDAGEQLIGSTFILVNDIRYIDKEKRAAVAGGILRGLGAIAGAITGINVSDLTDNIADMTEQIRGFRVRINSFLYQLEWDEAAASEVYQHWGDKEYFETHRDAFRLKYVGKVESSGSTTNMKGINADLPSMIRKSLNRAIDENVANLQKNFEQFRCKTPLVSTTPITAYIGMKDGVSEDSKYEVLETIEDENGHISYKRVATIRPKKKYIWDNRYMALEEGAPGSSLGFTTFEKIGGGELLPGMIIREIK